MRSNRDELHAIYSDAFKDEYGMRPRRDTSHWTEQDFLDEIEALSRDAEGLERDREIAAREAEYADAQAEYELERAREEAELEAERLDVMHDECFFGMTYDEMPLSGEDY